MQVPNGTGPGVQRSKRPLLARRIRYNKWKDASYSNKQPISNVVSMSKLNIETTLDFNVDSF